MADNRKHPAQSRINMSRIHRSSLVTLMVRTFMSKALVKRRTIPVTAPAQDMRPTLHKGDAGDFTPFEEVERIHNGTLSPPPAW
ncbi:MAG: hypothetical protein ABSH53_20720 [Holophaga sp.]